MLMLFLFKLLNSSVNRGSMHVACHEREDGQVQVQYRGKAGTAYYIRKTRLKHIVHYCHIFKFLQGDPVWAVHYSVHPYMAGVCYSILLRGLYRSPILTSTACTSYAYVVWRCSCKILSTYMYIGNVAKGYRHINRQAAGWQAGM